MNSLIQSALKTIGDKYTGCVLSWLRETNPVAARQLDSLQDKLDGAYLAGDEQGVRRLCKVWEENWLFWIANFRRK